MTDIRLPLKRQEHTVYDGAGYDFCYCPGDTTEEAEANAKFIVQTGNAYPALMKEAKQLIARLDTIWDWDNDPTPDETLDWMDDMLGEDISRLRNTIHVAEEAQ